MIGDKRLSEISDKIYDSTASVYPDIRYLLQVIDGLRGERDEVVQLVEEMLNGTGHLMPERLRDRAARLLGEEK